MTSVHPPDHGTLDHYYIADVFAMIFRRGRTGALRLEKDSYLKIVYVSEGLVAYASSNAKYDRLGEVLVRRGMLTREQLEDAIKRMEPRKSLGKILVELGYLSPKELVLGARLQVYTILDSLFQWDDGVYHFNETSLPPQVVNLKISMPSVVIDGVTNHARIEWVRKFIPEGHTAALELNENFYDHQSTLELRPNVEEVITWCDGVHTVEEIAEKTGLNAFFIAKVVASLVLLDFGILKLTAKPEAVALESTEAVEAPTPAPTSPPDKVESPDLEAEIASALSIFSKPQDAGSTTEAAPSSEPSPAPPPASAPPPAADETAPVPNPPPQPVEPEPTEKWPPPAPEPAPTPETPSEAPPPPLVTPTVSQPQDLREVLGGTTVAWSGHRKRTRTSTGLIRVVGVIVLVLFLGAAGYYFYRRYFAGEPETLRLPEYTRVESPTEAPPSPVKGPPEERITVKETPAPASAAPETSPAATTTSTPIEPVSPSKPATPVPSPAKEPPSSQKPVSPRVSPPSPAENPVTMPFQLPQLRATMSDAAFRQVARETLDRLRTIPTRHYTIQVELACQTDTIRKALEEVRDPGKLYILPKTFRGRSCFVVGYGLFDGRKAAEQARASELGSELLNQPSPPQIISMGTMRRRAGT